MPDHWRTIAREWVEPWEGARGIHWRKGWQEDGWILELRDDGFMGFLQDYGDMEYFEDYDDGATQHWAPDEDCDEQPITVDLTHPPTAREAVARLALFLGAPEETVAEGVRFYRAFDGWHVDAGISGSPGSQACWGPVFVCAPEAIRPLAIATAWMEARQAREREA